MVTSSSHIKNEARLFTAQSLFSKLNTKIDMQKKSVDFVKSTFKFTLQYTHWVAHNCL